VSEPVRILVVRLSAMGDVVNTLPAAASLKHGIPHSIISWIVEPRWAPLLEGNPYLDEVIPFDRRSFAGLRSAWGRLREQPFDLAVDFQGLVKSAVVASAAHARQVIGFDCNRARECAAAWFYSKKVPATRAHVVDQYLDVAAAAGASSLLRTFPIPPGAPEGRLPDEPFVLASPMAGWGAKQWPLEYYAELASRLRAECGLILVVNTPKPTDVPGAFTHVSGLPGLIDATRKALAVVGVDSGPLHLAAALNKPGVAIYGPTDPARNGPYESAMTVLRSPRAVTTYQRNEYDAAMREIAPGDVLEALQQQLSALTTAGTRQRRS
jgi:heptosyltransferase-1